MPSIYLNNKKTSDMEECQRTPFFKLKNTEKLKKCEEKPSSKAKFYVTWGVKDEVRKIY